MSIAEGIVAELVGACASGGVLTAWALYLDLSPLLVGLLGALPFGAHLVQIPSAWITRTQGSRRTALVAIGASRQLPAVLAALPWLELPLDAQRAVLLAVAGASSLLGVVGNNAWTSWMGELVPDRIRGRYFGRRAAFCALGSTVGALGAGIALDRARPGEGVGLVLSLLALASCALGGITVLLLRGQHEPAAARAARPTLAEAARPWRDAAARRALAFHVAWAAAGGVAAFYPIHMIANLRMGFVRMALYNGAIAAVRILAAPLWGRALDRVGARPVLVACCFGLCLSPVLWLFPRQGLLWPLAVDAVLCGALLAGQSLASFSLPLTLSPRGARPFQLAAFAAAGGLATCIASAAGGALAQVLPEHVGVFGRDAVPAQVLFLVGAALRLCAAALALRIVEPGSRPVQALGRLALHGALRRATLRLAEPALDAAGAAAAARRTSAA